MHFVMPPFMASNLSYETLDMNFAGSTASREPSLWDEGSIFDSSSLRMMRNRSAASSYTDLSIMSEDVSQMFNPLGRFGHLSHHKPEPTDLNTISGTVANDAFARASQQDPHHSKRHSNSAAPSIRCENCEEARPVAQLALCSWCDGGKAYYCLIHCSEEDCGHAVNCDQPGHATCWNSTHAWTRNRERHVQRDAVRAWCIDQILFSESDEGKQAAYHDADQQALWFRVSQVSPTLGPKRCVQVTKRLKQLWQGQSPPHNPGNYPSFVSVVGGIGVGKSTLVRAMMAIGAMERAHEGLTQPSTSNYLVGIEEMLEFQAPRPVTGLNHAGLQLRPTSTGVHLYQDVTSQSAHDRDHDLVTVLFADCEGFSAGTTQFTAARSDFIVPTAAYPTHRVVERSGMASSQSATRSAGAIETEDLRTSLPHDRMIAIRAQKLLIQGEGYAELFYARCLYPFSDVVLFVTDRAQKLGSELQRFLEVIANSVLPQKSPVTLIIAINKANSFSANMYDEGFLEHALFDGWPRIWESSATLNALKENHDRNVKARDDLISTNEQFFRLFFQQVRMCYIPQRGKDEILGDDKLYDQYGALRTMVMEGSMEGQKSRSSTYSRFDFPTVAHLLDKAFEHYATSDQSFGWYAAR